VACRGAKDAGAYVLDVSDELLRQCARCCAGVSVLRRTWRELVFGLGRWRRGLMRGEKAGSCG
jgi:hypothetical protein